VTLHHYLVVLVGKRHCYRHFEVSEMFRPYSELMKLFQFILLTVHHAAFFWFITNQLTHGVESFFEELIAPLLVKFPTIYGM